jgi:hypothetical protein
MCYVVGNILYVAASRAFQPMSFCSCNACIPGSFTTVRLQYSSQLALQASQKDSCSSSYFVYYTLVHKTLRASGICWLLRSGEWGLGFCLCSLFRFQWQTGQPLSHAGDFDFSLLSSRHIWIVSKPFSVAKRTFLRWRALPLGRDLGRVRHDANTPWVLRARHLAPVCL